jgi:hypothetical protein
MHPLFELAAPSYPIVVAWKTVLNKTEQTEGIRIMWINEVAPERLAELFHHYHQALVPEMSGKGSEGHGSWREIPQPEKSRLVSAARLALLELQSMTREGEKREYFARPGEAEWGC